MEVQVTKTRRKKIIGAVIDEMLGFGPIEPLLEDSTITEIMVNGPEEIFVERNGKIERASGVQFKNDNHIRQIIERIIAPLGRRIDNKNPYVDARLPDGSRVNAVIPPIAIDGPNITIRKFGTEKMTDDDLVGFGTITPQMLKFIEYCVKGKKNILISGGTGTGKTTFLNIVSDYIPKSDRIVTIEDSAELQLAHRNGGNLIRLETRPPNIEGEGEVTIEHLLKNSLRQRPDRIIVGEVRGTEAEHMLQSMNTGHPGSLSTIHANSSLDALTRLESMILAAGNNKPSKVVRKDIGSALDMIIQLQRFLDGTRKVVGIYEVVDYDTADEEFKTIPLYRYKQTSVRDEKVLGYFTPTGRKPTFFQDLQNRGLDITVDIFKNEDKKNNN
jgi:pilus assembly protein CpaF